MVCAPEFLYAAELQRERIRQPNPTNLDFTILYPAILIDHSDPERHGNIRATLQDLLQRRKDERRSGNYDASVQTKLEVQRICAEPQWFQLIQVQTQRLQNLVTEQLVQFGVQHRWADPDICQLDFDPIMDRALMQQQCHQIESQVNREVIAFHLPSSRVYVWNNVDFA